MPLFLLSWLEVVMGCVHRVSKATVQLKFHNGIVLESPFMGTPSVSDSRITILVKLSHNQMHKQIHIDLDPALRKELQKLRIVELCL